MMELQNISLHFGNQKILHEINERFSSGEVIGLVAPNGTGKSTLMNVMMNYVTPNSGSVRFKNGLTYSSKANEVKIHQMISMMPDQSDLYNHLSGKEHMKIYCTMWQSDREQIDKVIRMLDMENYINKKTGTYSLGMRQRLCFAMQIVADTEIMLMDEVMNGLDPINVELISSVLMEKKAEGKIIIIASHLLDNLEKYADRIFLFQAGKLMDVNTIVEGFSSSTMTTIRVKNMSNEMRAAFQAKYPTIPIQTLMNDITLLTLEGKESTAIGEMAIFLTELGVHNFTFGKVTLNDLYALYYGERKG